jgi:hypothetical protein
LSIKRCRLCDKTVWPGQKLVPTPEGKVHKKCQRVQVREAEESTAPNLTGYLRVPAAAILKGISREAMRQIVQRGDLPGYCEHCLEHLPIETLRRNEPQPHNCRSQAPGQRRNVVLRRKDVDEYEVMAVRQTVGRLGGLSTQRRDA